MHFYQHRLIFTPLSLYEYAVASIVHDSIIIIYVLYMLYHLLFYYRLLYAGVKLDKAKAMLTLYNDDPKAALRAIHQKIMMNIRLDNLYWFQRFDVRIGESMMIVNDYSDDDDSDSDDSCDDDDDDDEYNNDDCYSHDSHDSYDDYIYYC